MEMNMNMFNLMGFGAPAAMADAGLANPKGLQVEGAVDGEFVNLLDMAAEMEVGEFQNQSAEEWMASMLDQVQSGDSKNLDLAKQSLLVGLESLGGATVLGEEQDSLVVPNASLDASALSAEMSSLLNLGMNPQQIPNANVLLQGNKSGKEIVSSEQLKVGQKMPLGESSETQLLNDWAMNSLGLEAVKQKNAPAQNLPTAFAVSQWAQAVASGDMKSVEVISDEAPKVGGDLAMTGSDVLKWKAEPSMVGSERAEKAPERSAILSANLAALRSVEPNKDLIIAKTADAKLMDSKAKPSAEGFVAMVTKDLPQIKNGERVLGEKKLSSAQSEISMASEPVSAKEFMLKNEMGLSDQSSKLAPKTAPALVNSTNLGSVEDSRVSHQAVDFVAEKIDALRASGGGTLRVHLDPKDLGSVMLKVSSRGGVAKVEIVAEKAETAALLTQNKSDLFSRLQSSGIQTQLTVDQGHMSGANNSSSLLQAKGAAGMSSFDMMSLDRSGKTSEAQNSSAVRSAPSSSDMQAAGGEGGSDSWSRDERREFAREQWNSRQQKKTA